MQLIKNLCLVEKHTQQLNDEGKKFMILSNFKRHPHAVVSLPNYLQPPLPKKKLSVSHTRLKYGRRSVRPILGSSAVLLWWTPWSTLLVRVLIGVLILILSWIRRGILIWKIAGLICRRICPPLTRWWGP